MEHQDNSHIVDHDSSSLELSKFILSESDVLPKCLESLVHHSSLGRYTKDIVDLSGLPLLMEIHERYKHDVNITVKLCQIISFLSFNRSLLQPMHRSGWIGVLSEWVNHDDIRVCVPAARALANLDVDNKAVYSRRLYLLHPVTRTPKEHEVDVVFIHGLLGGVFYTWRQRNKPRNAWSSIGKHKKKDATLPETETDIGEPIKKIPVQKYFRGLIEQIEDEETYKDFELVWDDIPINTNISAEGPYTSPGKNGECNKEGTCDYTQCWPKDWLSEDCPNLRIIGVNYDTSLSMWAPICPAEKVKFTLDERSDDLLEKFLDIGLGNKPIVWVTHSMGGLIVKNMLCKDSPQLKKIHAEFLKIVKSVPMKIVTFVETKSTIVTAMKLNFLLVEPDSGNPGVGEYYEVPQDHLGICKPITKYSFLYQKVLCMLKRIVDEVESQ